MTIDLSTLSIIVLAFSSMAFVVLYALKVQMCRIVESENERLKTECSEIAVINARLATSEELLGKAHEALARKTEDLDQQTQELREMEGQLRAARTQVQAEVDNARNLLSEKDIQIRGQLKVIEEAKLQLKEVFASTASESLRIALEDFTSRTNSDQQLREQKYNELLKPIGEGLERLSKRCEETDKVLVAVQSGLSEQVRTMLDASTGLSNALRRPQVRGSWGEMTLRNALDEAGLIEGTDYCLQDTQATQDGRLRADAVVYLPQGQRLVIDCKTPLETFREAINETDLSIQTELFKKHSLGVRKHIAALSSKDYQAQYEGVDFIVMFLPTESMYQAAIEHDPEIVAYGHERKVYIANPITLLGVLKATAHVMSLVRSNQEAANIRKLGEEIYKSLVKFSGTYARVGAKIAGVVHEYNESVASLEGNLLVKARKFAGLGVGGSNLEAPQAVEHSVRMLVKPELQAQTEGDKLD